MYGCEKAAEVFVVVFAGTRKVAPRVGERVDVRHILRVSAVKFIVIPYPRLQD